MLISSTFSVATPQAVDEARRALRIARRYRTIQLTETPAARFGAIVAGLAEVCIDRLLAMGPRIASAVR